MIIAEPWYTFLALDFPALFTAIAASVACGLLGSLLVLRRESLMGDAISHAVLPGIVVAFLLTGSRASLPVFLGATAAGILATVCIAMIKRLGRMDAGAAMGVVFPLFFALGVVLIEQAAARSVDLDADCLLHGQLETIFWYPPVNLSEWRFALLADLPRELIVSVVVALFAILFVITFHKELKLTAFDSALADSMGISSSLLYYLLMIVVACAVVASFEVVGSILVIAMIICPGATARLLTDNFRHHLILSGLLAAIMATSGYILGAFAPGWFGYDMSLNAAGMMAVMAGVILALGVFFSPRYGIVFVFTRRYWLGLQMQSEDVIGALYRFQESQGQKAIAATAQLQQLLPHIKQLLPLRLLLQRRGYVLVENDHWNLTPHGLTAARDLVRSHRLWERYLVDQTALKSDHVHPRAEEFEHYTSSAVQHQLAELSPFATADPHGKEIPAASEEPSEDSSGKKE